MKEYYIEIDTMYYCIKCMNKWVGIILDEGMKCFYCGRHLKIDCEKKVQVDKNTYDLLLGIAG